MNRSIKALVVAVLALAVGMSFVTAFAQKNGTHAKPTKAPQVTIEGIALSLTDKEGNLLTAGDDGSNTLVGGRRYIIKATTTPETTNPSLRWRSNKPSVASVSNRGVVYCNRSGTAIITVSNKSGSVSETITLNVKKNMTDIDTTANKTVKKIYLKGNNLCMDVVLVNSTAEAIETAPDLNFFLKLFDATSYTDLGVKSGHLRKTIAAGETGTAVYKIQKVNSRTIWLLGASANCQLP